MNNSVKSILFIILSFILLWSCISADQLFSGGGEKSLDENTIIAGLKEALEIGTKNAVNIVSIEDGFYKSVDVFIPLPEKLKEVASKLRSFGLGDKVDEFIKKMNRAAEKAAVEAVTIFIDAIKKMTLADARNILAGADDAATRFFEKHTRPELYNIFFPVIKNVMDNIGVTQLYKFLINTYNEIPFVNKVTYELDEYITNKALDGLFFMLAKEEKKIRKDPVARITELLRKVFG